MTYKITYNRTSKVYRVTLPKTLVDALSVDETNVINWKMHPDGKNLIMEFVRN